MAINLGQYLIRLLEAYDVEHVFGIPGVHTAELYRGLATSPIRHVTPRHEQGAGFMADGYARVTGKPGVCLVITGPGLSNISTAMLQARADSIPMLVIAGVNDPSGQPLGRLHEMPDQFAFGGQIASASWRVTDPVHLPAAFAEAFALFESRRPGPVLIEIPLGSMSADAGFLPAPVRSDHAVANLPDLTLLDRAATLIADAQKPVLIAGGGARRARGAVLDMADRIGAPVIATINARSCFAKDDPRVISATPSIPEVRAFIDAADLVLAVGTELGPTDFDMYDTNTTIQPRKLVRIEIDPDLQNRAPFADVFLASDASAVLSELANRVPDSPASVDIDQVAAITRQAHAALPEVYRSHVSVLETIHDTLPDAILVGDSTQLVYAGNMYFAPGDQGGWFNSSVGYGTLGYGLPAAIGAKLARPGNPVVVLIGDGGIQFTLGDLGGVRDEATPLIIIVWNNSGYGEIKSFMIDNAVRPEGVDLTPPDFSLLAQAYGIDYCRLTESDLCERLKPVLEDANRSASGMLVEISAI